jgi:uncharacterized membrane protein (Fun14 family)
MANNILGMLVGAELSERDGGSGIKGAIEGYVAQGALRVVTPLVVTYAIGWGVQFLARRAVHALTSDDDLKQGTVVRG